jgi:oligogalacturonide lyase
VASADLAKGELTLHSQYPAWHTHGSPDGRWIMGDDFDRNLWLIEAATGERRLLTQGHQCEGGTNHPHASFTPDSRSIVFTSSRGGADDIYLVDLPEWKSLPIAESPQ